MIKPPGKPGIATYFSTKTTKLDTPLVKLGGSFHKPHALSYGHGSKLNHQRTAGFSPCFKQTRVPFGYLFLTHTRMGLAHSQILNDHQRAFTQSATHSPKKTQQAKGIKKSPASTSNEAFQPNARFNCFNVELAGRNACLLLVW